MSNLENRNYDQCPQECKKYWVSTKSFTAVCPDGKVGSSVTKTVQRTSYLSQQNADELAQTAAECQAKMALVCVFESTQSFTASCAYGGIPVTQTATAQSSKSQLEADVLAIAAAQTAAEALLVCPFITGVTFQVLGQQYAGGSIPPDPYNTYRVNGGSILWDGVTFNNGDTFDTNLPPVTTYTVLSGNPVLYRYGGWDDDYRMRVVRNGVETVLQDLRRGRYDAGGGAGVSELPAETINYPFLPGDIIYVDVFDGWIGGWKGGPFSLTINYSDLTTQVYELGEWIQGTTPSGVDVITGNLVIGKWYYPRGGNLVHNGITYAVNVPFQAVNPIYISIGGIARLSPSRYQISFGNAIPSGNLMIGHKYLVSGGISVTCGLVTTLAGLEFTATAETFISNGGSLVVVNDYYDNPPYFADYYLAGSLTL